MKINYDRLMMEELTGLESKPSILLHSCCGPCSTACIERLKDLANVTILYYNPNIEPKEEYEHRKSEQLRILEILGIDYIDIDYDNENWKEKVKHLSEEKEGGERCSLCFSIRLNRTADVAKENSFDYFATTLTVSPHKNSELINTLGLKIAEVKNINFLPSDFKKREGYKRSIELSKEFNLYRQDYCGCLYSKVDREEE